MTAQVRPGPAETAAQRRHRLAEALRARQRQVAPAPLAPNQERLFAVQQMDPSSTAYAETVVLRLRGQLDDEALVAALHALPRRHEWLRSRIEIHRDGPVQVVDDALVPVVQRAAVAGSGRELGPEAVSWVRALAQEPLSLLDGPIWRAGLARLDPEDHLLVLVVHHVACDASSLAVLLEELGEHYDATLTGRSTEHSPTRSPREIAREVRAWQSSDDARAAVERHVAALSGADFEARLVARPGIGNDDPGAVAVCRRRLPSDVSSRVAAVAAEHGLTPFAVVGGAIGQTLADTLGTERPVLGMPVDLRWHLDDADDVVSFLVETVGIVLPGALDQSLVATAADISTAVAAALAQPPPFDDVVARLRRTGQLPLTGTPLHAYVNWLDGEEQTTLGTHGPGVTHLDLPLGPAKFDLAWTAVARGRDVELRLEYDSARLDEEAAGQLVDGVVRLLDVATRRPETPLADLDLLSERELAQLAAWEGQPPPEAAAPDLFSVLEEAIAVTDGPVLISGEEAVHGPDLLARVDLLASALRQAGVGPGDRVAVPGHRVPGMVVSLLAVLRAGATYLPLDPAHPRARQAELARSSGVRAIVGAPDWAEDLASAAGAQAVGTDGGGRPLRPAPLVRQWSRRSASDLAYVMYTSGSTGRPKAVRVPDSAVVARIESYREILAAEGVRLLMQSTLAFDASVYLFWALATRGCLVLPRDREAGDPLALARLMGQHAVTDAFFVPALYEALLSVAVPGELGAVQRVCVGGDVVPPSVARLHHTTLPRATLLDVYGPTEAVVTSTSTAIGPEDLVDGRPLPIGRPHPGTVAQVLDRRGRRVPAGVVGELHLGGPCIADGYDGVADDVSGPFSVRKDENGRVLRWYATGDLVRWRSDGRLDYVGRRDRQLKVRGQRVELGEIEAAARSLPGVGEAAVEPVGSGSERRLVLFVEPEVPDVRPGLTGLLPAAWVPDVVVALPALPRLPSGKLDRPALREHSPTSTPVTPHAPTDDDRARWTGLERAVLSIIRALLGDEQVGMDDDFFAVGGNSLLAARLVGQLNAMLGAAIPLHELVGHSTPRRLAALADRDFSRRTAAPREGAQLIPVRESGTGPPVVLIARDGATSLVLQHFLSRVDGDRPMFVLLRPMPPLGFRLPDLVADGALVANLLRERLPDGPVHLVGHSASGIVTLEAARALGDRRGATVLLDTVPPPRWSATSMRRPIDLARRVIERRRLRRNGIRVPASGEPDPDPRAARALRLYQDGLAAARTRLRPIDFPLTVFTSASTRAELGRQDIGWDRFAAAELELVPMGGDHLSLLLQPDVVETARKIDGVLSAWQ